MSKKLLDQQPERERRRDVYEQGQEVYAKHLGLWSRGVYIQHNTNGTIKVRLGKSRVDLKSIDVAPIRK